MSVHTDEWGSLSLAAMHKSAGPTGAAPLLRLKQDLRTSLWPAGTASRTSAQPGVPQVVLTDATWHGRLAHAALPWPAANAAQRGPSPAPAAVGSHMRGASSGGGRRSGLARGAACADAAGAAIGVSWRGGRGAGNGAQKVGEQDCGHGGDAACEAGDVSAGMGEGSRSKVRSRTFPSRAKAARSGSVVMESSGDRERDRGTEGQRDRGIE